VVDYAALIHPSGVVAVPTSRRKVSPDGPPCRVCLKPLETAFQPSLTARDGFEIYTCHGALCAMKHQTISAPDYDSVDLSRYGAVEHPDYRAVKAEYEKERVR
jgi:hypothetical protein